jgi:hypothetical protein
LSPIAIGAGGPRLVGLRFRWQRTVWQIVEHVIVRIVIDDRRKRRITLPRIIALWRINLRWRVGLSRRVVLRESPPSQRPDADH